MMQHANYVVKTNKVHVIKLTLRAVQVKILITWELVICEVIAVHSSLQLTGSVQISDIFLVVF